jgi:hypothetical protein
MEPDRLEGPNGAMVKWAVVALVIATALGWGGGSASGGDPPALPPMPEKFKNIQIVSPSPDTPKEIAAFSGAWEGVWKVRFVPIYIAAAPGTPSRRGKLIVYEVSKDKIKYLWAIGENPNSTRRGGWANITAEIEDLDGKKSFSHFSSKQGISVTFSMENGKLIGKMKDLEIEMDRVK